MHTKIILCDDDCESVGLLFRLRIFSLVLGLFLGLVLSFVTSRFEEVLLKNVSVAFFIPFIVYLASAVGNQTQSIYARDLKSGKASFHNYLIKETLLGILFGLIFAAITIPIILIWFKSQELATSVSLSLFFAISTAPVISLIITKLLQAKNSDPAAGAGPLATVVQDTVSVLIYGFIASTIIS